jgi:chaperone BCS1
MTFNELINNPLITGGLFLGASGLLVASLRNIPAKIFGGLRRCFVTTLRLREQDSTFAWIDKWLAMNVKSRILIGQAMYNIKGSKRARVILTPAYGLHIIWYKKTLALIWRGKEDQPAGGKNNDPLANLLSRDEFFITFFTRKREVIMDFLESAQDLSLPDDNALSVCVRGTDYWMNRVCITKRDMESVITHDGLHYRILEDIQVFQKAKQRYLELGIPYRRGYLLHGPPGSGKTSTIRALASKLEMDIYYLTLRGLTDRELLSLITSVPDTAMILIEDIDCIEVTHTRHKEDIVVSKEVTLSGLLNVLDGICSADGRIIFMTTNHIDKLDPALVRAGRIDMKFLFDNVTLSQAQEMFLKFFPGHSVASIRFTQGLQDRTTSMADVQEHLIRYRDDLQSAISKTRWAQEVNSYEVSNL